MRPSNLLLFLTSFFIAVFLTARDNVLKRIVFLNENKNGLFDAGELGIENVCLSNGKDVVQTNAGGQWELTGGNAYPVFVIKPAGYSVPLNHQDIPQHYYLKEDVKYKTDIKFPLYPAEEGDKFFVLFFGDMQARGLREVNFILHDVVEERLGTDAAFGVSLGGIEADDSGLFAEASQE